MPEPFTGPALAFSNQLHLLADHARAAGLLVAPGAGAADLDELVRIAAARITTAPGGRRSSYTAMLTVATLDGSPLPAGSWERAGQMWEALGGTWGGRISPEARGLFVWTFPA